MNSEENEETGAESSTPRKAGSSAKRVTMSGVESADTAPNTPDDKGPADEVFVLENGGDGDEDDDKPPSKLLTKIEKLVDKVERRRDNRMAVSSKARNHFVALCLQKVSELGGNRNSGIPLAELRKMRDTQKENGGQVGEIFESAVNVMEEAEGRFFYYRSFNEYYLTLEENYFRRNPSIAALAGVLAYYICSLVLFCGILGNNSTCPSTDGRPIYEGWLTAIYFASVTISTVGYGDVSFVGSGTEVWRVLIGTLYMIVAMVVAVTVFSSLSSKALEFTGSAVAPQLEPLIEKFISLEKNESLTTQLRRVWLFKIFELSVTFLLINVFGMCVAMLVMGTTKDGDEIDWSWMTAFYWAVQTTTTIGYGDLDMPFDLRWFNFLFAIIGTTFAASILGSLAELDSKLKNMRTLYIWQNREVSMQLINDMEGDGDKQLDEYEFLIGSLLTLELVQREDVEKIMDKFRDLAGMDQVIDTRDIEQHQRQLSALRISKADIEKYNAKKREEMDYWQDVDHAADENAQ
ncbi:unnamed protein product [Cylindrotheca closterium]|uniref:Potassium channel domain-containing protein n=1 Tax=Cylindrotheca closterium TaxID=2856 RepID=A0AAD2FUT9_9STRA|nr:unnamed protein product [Cylindrotheca closterium]